MHRSPERGDTARMFELVPPLSGLRRMWGKILVPHGTGNGYVSPPGFVERSDCRACILKTRLLSQLLDRHIAKHHRIVVASKAKVATLEILAGVWRVVFELGDRTNIRIHDNAAVEFDFDR